MSGKGLIIGCCFIPLMLHGQFQMTWNAEIDLELTKAGKLSHYFYNEIHRENTGWKLDLARTHVLTKLNWSKSWEINVHGMTERQNGKRPGFFKDVETYQLYLPLFNIKKNFLKDSTSLTLGRFINPFGTFFSQQLNKDRIFLGSPLAYSHFTDVSQFVGLVPSLGDSVSMRIHSEPDWGSPILYRLGYTAGIRFDWGKADKLSGTVAVVNGAPNQLRQLNNPINWGVVSTLQFPLSYYSKIGLSVSHGTFLQRVAQNESIENLAISRQTLIGMSYLIGSGFLELSGEIIGARYKVPQYLVKENRFREITSSFQEHFLSALTGYADIKYEIPTLPGSYLAYRFDALGYGKFENIKYEIVEWDNPVSRHSFAAGYKINAFTQAKGMFSTQQVANRDWDNRQRVLRLMLIFHW